MGCGGWGAGADAGEAALQAWAGAAKALFDAHPVPEALSETVPGTLTGQLVWHGYSPEVADRIAKFVLAEAGANPAAG